MYGPVESQKKLPYTYGQVCYETFTTVSQQHVFRTFDEKITRNCHQVAMDQSIANYNTGNDKINNYKIIDHAYTTPI